MSSEEKAKNLGKLAANGDQEAIQELENDREALSELAGLVDWDVVDSGIEDPVKMEELIALARRAKRHPGSDAIERMRDKVTPSLILSVLGENRYMAARMKNGDEGDRDRANRLESDLNEAQAELREFRSKFEAKRQEAKDLREENRRLRGKLR